MMTEENGPGTAGTPADAASAPAPADPPAPEARGDAADIATAPPPAPEADAPPPPPGPAETTREPATADRAVPRRPAGVRFGALFGAALAGGVLAAALGFALAHFDVFGLRPPAPPDPAAQLAALGTRIDGLAAGIAEARETAGAALDAARAEGDSAPLAARLDALEASVADLRDAAADPPPADAGALRALIREELDARGAGDGAAARAAAEAAAETAAKAAEAAAQQAAAEAVQAARHAAALQTLADALASGAPYAAALETLAPEDAPAALARHAGTGLPTLATLKAGFPDAARGALAAALRDGAGEGGIGARIWAFLRIESGARSLTPREGDDPDAILSRAEAMVEAGDLAGALGALAALSPAGLEAMAPWTAAAQDRLDAEAALSALAAPPPTPAAP